MNHSTNIPDTSREPVSTSRSLSDMEQQPRYLMIFIGIVLIILYLVFLGSVFFTASEQALTKRGNRVFLTTFSSFLENAHSSISSYADICKNLLQQYSDTSVGEQGHEQYVPIARHDLNTCLYQLNELKRTVGVFDQHLGIYEDFVAKAFPY